jgi:hypothetical protein
MPRAIGQRAEHEERLPRHRLDSHPVNVLETKILVHGQHRSLAALAQRASRSERDVLSIEALGVEREDRASARSSGQAAGFDAGMAARLRGIGNLTAPAASRGAVIVRILCRRPGGEHGG